MLGFGRALFLHKKAVSKIVASVPSFSLSLLSQIHKFLAENWLVSTCKHGEKDMNKQKTQIEISSPLWSRTLEEKSRCCCCWLFESLYLRKGHEWPSPYYSALYFFPFLSTTLERQGHSEVFRSDLSAVNCLKVPSNTFEILGNKFSRQMSGLKKIGCRPNALKKNKSAN